MNDFFNIDTRGQKYTDPQIGDQVRLEFPVKGSNESAVHSIFITKISGNYITFADCNSELGDCKIRWNATTYYDSFKYVNGKNYGDGKQKNCR